MQKENPKKLIGAALMIEAAGSLESAIEQWQTISESTQSIEPLINLQVLLNLAGREAEAFAASNRQLEINPRDPRVIFNRGWHLIQRGDFKQGFACLEAGRYLNCYGTPMPKTPKPPWRGESLEGKTIVLRLEGGFGDEFICFRFFETLKQRGAKNIILASMPQSMEFYAAQNNVGTVIDAAYANRAHFDYWLGGMSAAFALGLELSDLPPDPYITADPLRREIWNRQLNAASGGRLKVGIRWSGNPQFEHQQYRNFPPQILTDLHKLQEIQLFSFQRDNDLLDLPEQIIDLQHDLDTWQETAAALSEMDLVITSCTSIAHLSAALGRPTWVIVPVLPYYIWALPGEKSPWYKDVTLFRQEHFGEWSGLKPKLEAKLRELLK